MNRRKEVNSVPWGENGGRKKWAGFVGKVVFCTFKARVEQLSRSVLGYWMNRRKEGEESKVEALRGKKKYMNGVNDDMVGLFSLQGVLRAVK